MAVHCSICASRISCAPDNYGRYPTTEAFKGWDTAGDGYGADKYQKAGKPNINDTCEDCYRILQIVHDKYVLELTEVANFIVERNQERVDKLKAEIQAEKDRQTKFDRDKRAFENDWYTRNK